MSTGQRLVVINLQPFNTEKIEQYLAQRLAASKAVPGHPAHNVNDTLAFIDRVYDLWDLASRPLLLKLIVDTILEGGIDVTDPTLQFGPSDLYELYTSIKLDLDWGKGPVRRGALTRDQRRQFAETVAVAMHEAGGLFNHHYCIGRRNRARSPLPACSHTYQSGIDTGRLPR
jgi:hypothetical protein